MKRFHQFQTMEETEDGPYILFTDHEEEIKRAVAAEREACAQLMEIHSQWVYTADELAHAIRQRGA